MLSARASAVLPALAVLLIAHAAVQTFHVFEQMRQSVILLLFHSFIFRPSFIGRSKYDISHLRRLQHHERFIYLHEHGRTRITSTVEHHTVFRYRNGKKQQTVLSSRWHS